jgi:hypothetical protein
MELRADHRFSAPPAEVARAMVDPAFAARWDRILDVASVEILDHGSDDGSAWVAARLTYGGSLDPLAARVLGSSHPTWVQTYRVDLAATRGLLTIEPDHHRSVLHCEAEVTLRATDDTMTRRELRGELVVRVPLLGSRAERALAPAIGARIDAEAELLEAWLTER